MRSKSAQFLADADAEYDPKLLNDLGPDAWDFLPGSEDTEIARELARAAESAHRPAEAEHHLRTVVRNSGWEGPTLGEHARARQALAQLAAARGDLAEAEHQARLALALVERLDVAVLLASLVERQGRPEEAARLRARALARCEAAAQARPTGDAPTLAQLRAFFDREPPAHAPGHVLLWSYGRVRTSAQEGPDGLRSEVVFGPRQPWRCACGARSGLESLGLICERCRVEVLAASPRAVRPGHIRLPRPVLHPHLRRGNPSRLARLLYLRQHQLEAVRRGEALLVVDTHGYSLDYRPGEVLRLSDGPALRQMYGEDQLTLGTGAEALVAHLRTLDLEGLRSQLESTLLQPLLPSNRARLEGQLEAATSLRGLRGGLEWACLEALPVLPPKAALPGRPGRRALDRAYTRVLDACTALEHLGPGPEPAEEQRLFALELQASVDALFDLFR